MTTVASIAALIAGFAIAVVTVRAVAARRGLGLVHPASLWLLLTAVFFGPGSVVLALDSRPGPGAFVGAATAALAVGLRASDSLARRRAASNPLLDGWAAAVRWPVVAGLALLGVLVIVPALLRTGLPFLVHDITASRAELGGLTVQLLRVALPGAAALALLSAADGPRRSAWIAAISILAIGAFETLLASRYLIAELAATLVIAWLLAGRRIRRDIAVAVLVVAVIGFAGIQVLRAYDNAAGNSIGFAAARTVNRIVLIQPRTIAALMDAIPARQGYFLGLTWFRRLGPLIGRSDIPNLGYWIYPDVVTGEQATAGYAAPGWLGEAWANFGWAGIALFAALGVAVERLGALVASRTSAPGETRGPVDVAAAAMAILFVARTHALGVLGLLVLLALVAAWRLLVAPPAGLFRDVRRAVTWRI